MSNPLAVPPGTLPPNHSIVCAAPPICTAVGIYCVRPCAIISATVVILSPVVGTFVKFAVKFAAGAVW